MIAPSGPFVVEWLKDGLTRLRTRYVVSHRDDLFAREGYLAGDDARRTSELVEALEDPSVDVILAARGGYGATRLVDRIAVDLVASARKPIVGFSDVTALHALWARAGVPSLLASMAAAGVGRMDDVAFARWSGRLEQPAARLDALSVIAAGRAEGPIVGGNLAVLAALLGTPNALDARGAILFLEDVGEAPYRVDRMLTSLRSSGALRGIAGIALGAFTGSKPGEDGTTIEAVLRERLGDLGVPVVAGVPAGHIDDHHEIWLGVPASLEATGSAGSLAIGSVAVARTTGPGVV